MGDSPKPGATSGRWAIGAIIAVCVAGTSFSLAGDKAEALRDQSIEANLLAEGGTQSWQDYCRHYIAQTTNLEDHIPSPRDDARRRLVEAFTRHFPKANTQDLFVDGVLICPVPRDTMKLEEALDLDNGSPGVVELFPSPGIVDWLADAAGKDEWLSNTLEPSDKVGRLRNDIALAGRAFRDGGKVKSVVAYYGDEQNQSSGTDAEGRMIGVAQSQLDPKLFHIDFLLDYATGERPFGSIEGTAQLDMRLTNALFVSYPGNQHDPLDFYFNDRAHQDPHYSGEKATWFNFPALHQRLNDFRGKTVHDTVFQLAADLKAKESTLSIFGLDLSLLQFAIFSAATMVVASVVFARAIAMAGQEALPPVLCDLPRALAGLVTGLIVVVWPCAILLQFRSAFRHAYPELGSPILFAAGAWALIAIFLLATSAAKANTGRIAVPLSVPLWGRSAGGGRQN